jgi:EmrB/QacA subfamily drug resistance transporter
MANPPQSSPRPRFWLVPLVVASALFMENMDATVIATSLPAIAADLGEDPVVLKLAFTAYLLSLAVFIPVSGWFADRYGARRVFTTAIAVFTLASIWCASAGSLAELVAARAAQGAGGAMMVPVARLIILRSVPKHQLVAAMAYLTVPALIGPVIGPPLGGFITTYFHWRWIFWINVPIGIVGIVLAWRFVPDTKAEQSPPLDAIGFVVAGLALVSLMAGLTGAGGGVFPAMLSPLLMAVGAGLGLAYWRHQRRTPHAILNLDLLRIATFQTSVLGGAPFRIAAGAVPFLLPMMLQVGFGLDPFTSGSLTFVAAAGAIAMKFTAQPILRRFGFRTVLTVNALIGAAFLLAISLFSAATPYWLIIAVLLVGGFFRSLQFTSLNTIAYSDVAHPAMSQATSLAGTTQQVWSALGITFAALVVEVSRGVRGDALLDAADFTVAFIAVGLLAATSAMSHARLSADAGAEISGRVPERAAGE